jgi:Stress responsive A/B Barrel Domain
MIRKAVWITALALVWALTSKCSAEPVKAAGKEEKPATKTPAYTHVVLFRLTKDSPEGEAEALIKDCHELLGKISTVRTLKAGRPSDKGTPNVGKKDYAVALLVLFDDTDGLKAYVEDEKHLDFVK